MLYSVSTEEVKLATKRNLKRLLGETLRIATMTRPDGKFYHYTKINVRDNRADSAIDPRLAVVRQLKFGKWQED